MISANNKIFSILFSIATINMHMCNNDNTFVAGSRIQKTNPNNTIYSAYNFPNIDLNSVPKTTESNTAKKGDRSYEDCYNTFKKPEGLVLREVAGKMCPYGVYIHLGYDRYLKVPYFLKWEKQDPMNITTTISTSGVGNRAGYITYFCLDIHQNPLLEESFVDRFFTRRIFEYKCTVSSVDANPLVVKITHADDINSIALSLVGGGEIVA
eukprot:Pgem_evm1s10105